MKFSSYWDLGMATPGGRNLACLGKFIDAALHVAALIPINPNKSSGQTDTGFI